MEFTAEIAAGMGLATDKGISHLGDRITDLIRPEANTIHRTIPSSGIMPASGGLVLEFASGPPYGAIWYPVWITVFGPDDRTAVANSSVAVYAGGEEYAPSLANLLIPATTATVLPWFYRIGKDTIPILTGDDVFAVVYGAAAGTQIGAVLRVREVRPSALAEKQSI